VGNTCWAPNKQIPRQLGEPSEIGDIEKEYQPERGTDAQTSVIKRKRTAKTVEPSSRDLRSKKVERGQNGKEGNKNPFNKISPVPLSQTIDLESPVVTDEESAEFSEEDLVEEIKEPHSSEKYGCRWGCSNIGTRYKSEFARNDH
jgi:hypothetical protein